MLVTAAAVGLVVWKFAPRIPGYATLDRAVFETTARSYANPPFFVSGNGSPEQPWSLRTLSSRGSKGLGEVVPVIAIGDDTDGVFQSSPPSAVDYAVILRNLKRLGVRRVAVSAVMAWDEADPLALTAVDSRFAEFDSAVTTAPLTRSAVAENLPLPFFLASIAADRAHGDVSALPQVNRLALPGTFLGSGKTLAGFSLIESEPGPSALVARWKDRLVFSFPVVAALAQSGNSADQIEVRLGSYLKLGPGGPVVPIDASGHAAAATENFTVKVIPAQAVIDASELESGNTVVIRDDRTTADPETARFSGTVVNQLNSITRETGLAPARVFRSLPVTGELGMILGVALLLAVCAVNSRFTLRLIFALVTALVLFVQLSGHLWFSLWLPLAPSLCAIAGGWLAAGTVKFSPSTAEPTVAPVHIPEPPPEPSVVEPPAAKTRAAKKTTGVTAKKATTKTTPVEADLFSEKVTKKVAKKAPPAKKAAKKAAAPAEKPPSKKAAKKAAKKAPKPPKST